MQEEDRVEGCDWNTTHMSGPTYDIVVCVVEILQGAVRSVHKWLVIFIPEYSATLIALQARFLSCEIEVIVVFRRHQI